MSTLIFYDSEYRITKTLYADGNAIVNEYDLEGLITKRTDQKLDVCIYLYDDRDLLTKKTYGASGVQTFAWDSMRRKTQDTDNNSALQTVTCDYLYDTLHSMTSQAQTVGSGTIQTVSKFYDAYGHRTRVTYPHGRNVDKTFNALHQNDLIKTDLGSGIVTIADYDYLYDSGPDKRQLVSKNTLNSGTDTRVDFGYDEMGRVTKKNWIDISAPATIVGFEYTYDLFGNRLTDNHLHRSVDSETYLYDSAQRFTKYERGTLGGSPSFYQSYTLDDLANWSSFNNNGTTESRTHNNVNELTVRGATSLTYESNGNLTDDGNQKYVWDELNRLIQVKDSGNSLIVDYYYNADNLRVEKHFAGGAKEQFYYCDAFVVEDQDGSQALVREYMQGSQYVDEVIAVKTGGNYYYYMYDLRFNEYGFVDSTGAVVERARYDGYGMRTLMNASFTTIGFSVVDQPYSYTGQRLDSESGLQYYRARYFDNDMGRFINRDPLGYVDGLNLYRGYFVPRGMDPSGTKQTYGSTLVTISAPHCKPCEKDTCFERPKMSIKVTTTINNVMIVDVTDTETKVKKELKFYRTIKNYNRTYDHEMVHRANAKIIMKKITDTKYQTRFDKLQPCLDEYKKATEDISKRFKDEENHDPDADPKPPTPTTPQEDQQEALDNYNAGLVPGTDTSPAYKAIPADESHNE